MQPPGKLSSVVLVLKLPSSAFYSLRRKCSLRLSFGPVTAEETTASTSRLTQKEKQVQKAETKISNENPIDLTRLVHLPPVVRRGGKLYPADNLLSSI